MPDDKLIQSSCSSTPTAAGQFFLFAELPTDCFNDSKNVLKVRLNGCSEWTQKSTCEEWTTKRKSKTKQNLLGRTKRDEITQKYNSVVGKKK